MTYDIVLIAIRGDVGGNGDGAIMGDLLIRGISPETHDELKRRAQQDGVSLQTYVARLLKRATTVPSLADWVEQLEELPRHREASGAQAVRDARDELP